MAILAPEHPARRVQQRRRPPKARRLALVEPRKRPVPAPWGPPPGKRRLTQSRLLAMIASSLMLLVLMIRTSGTPHTPKPFKSVRALDTADPWILYWRGLYYYTATVSPSGASEIDIWAAPTLAGLATAKPVRVWQAPPGTSHSAEIWGPELHYLDGAWYIYYSADDGDNVHHRMFVLKGNSQNPLGTYTDMGQLREPGNSWAIDPDVFWGADGQLYLVWSGWATPNGREFPQNIYIARMRDPLHLEGQRVLISTPTHPWETRGEPINEGPLGFVHEGKTYITFSGSASWTDDYAVGLLTNTDGNLLDPDSWQKTGPIFAQRGDVYGPGSFAPVFDADGSARWFLYHAADAQGSGWVRGLRAQPLYWNPDGSPLLGYPTPPTKTFGVLPDSSHLAHLSPSATLMTFDNGWGNAFGASSSLTLYGNGHQTGTWNIVSPGQATSETLGTARWSSLYQGNPNLEDYTVTTELTLLQSGTTSPYPKYGIYACFNDSANYVVAFLDPRNHLLATSGVVLGVAQPWVSTPLPATFDFTKAHTLQVQKVGSRFTFALDGHTVGDPRTFAIPNGEIGLVTEDTRASFASVAVSQEPQAPPNARMHG